MYWLKADKLIKKYYNSNDSEDLSEFLIFFDSYVKKCAYETTSKAHRSGIWICYEDFYGEIWFSMAAKQRSMTLSSFKHKIRNEIVG